MEFSSRSFFLLVDFFFFFGSQCSFKICIGQDVITFLFLLLCFFFCLFWFVFVVSCYCLSLSLSCSWSMRKNLFFCCCCYDRKWNWNSRIISVCLILLLLMLMLFLFWIKLLFRFVYDWCCYLCLIFNLFSSLLLSGKECDCFFIHKTKKQVRKLKIEIACLWKNCVCVCLCVCWFYLFMCLWSEANESHRLNWFSLYELHRNEVLNVMIHPLNSAETQYISKIVELPIAKQINDLKILKIASRQWVYVALWCAQLPVYLYIHLYLFIPSNVCVCVFCCCFVLFVFCVWISYRIQFILNFSYSLLAIL